MARKPRVLIIGGASEGIIHPIPPVADGAPEWNVFRLVEHEPDCDVLVVSPCEQSQYEQVANFPVKGRYAQIVFSPFQTWVYRTILKKVLPLRLVVRRLAKLPDLFSWWYLNQVVKTIRAYSPDLVLINARPQYIRYLRRRVEKGRLFMFVRGPGGESIRHLTLLDGIIVNSQGMRQYVAPHISPENTPVYFVPNVLGDDFPVPDPEPDRFTREHKTIVYAGRIIPEKGVLELIQAFKIVKEKVPNARLVMCGAEDNFKFSAHLTSYERQVREAINQLEPGSVEFAGYIPTTQMGKFYAAADLAVFPSVYVESFGMVALEAMRCGAPVVASRRPGFEELIAHGETGLLVDDPQNIEALAGAMIFVLSDPAAAQEMGEKGYRRSLNYLPEAAVQNFEEFVKSEFRFEESER